MQIRQALSAAVAALQQSPTPLVDARLLLSHLLNVPSAALIAHDDEPLAAAAQEQFTALVARAQAGEPIPYIIGSAPFYDLTFQVTPAVLIPRPETEQIVDLARRWDRRNPVRTIVDVGTGSGCLAVTLARHLPAAQVTAVDAAPAALAVAQANADRYELGSRIAFRPGDLLTGIANRPDLLVANLPYIADDEWTELDPGVKLHEPALALRGGPDGLDLIRRLLTQAAAWPPAEPWLMLLEIGWQQGAAARRLAARLFPDNAVTVRPDLAGHDRILEIASSLIAYDD